ncbi:MAG: TetR/AcrR family transcriptional regulator [Phenylobacterium sp.]|nr:TetR/AcrR family transcriptional regulator [Phenylobacterium sp.]
MRLNAKHAAYEIHSVRTRTLDAAAIILAQRGVEEFSLREVADKARIGVASIYHYFSNKEDLFLNLAIEGYEDLHSNIISFQDRPEYPSCMEAAEAAYFSFVEHKPALFSLMFNERLMARHEELRAAERRTFLAYQETIESDGRFPPAARVNVASALWALGRGIAAMYYSEPDNRVLMQMLEAIWAGTAYLIDRSDYPGEGVDALLKEPKMATG